MIGKRGLKRIGIIVGVAFIFMGASNISAVSSDALQFETTNGNNWAIELGTFSNYIKARNNLLSAQEQAPELLNKRTNIYPIEADYAVVYTSKIINLSYDEAEASCNHLKKSNQSCTVVSMKEVTQLTLAYN